MVEGGRWKGSCPAGHWEDQDQPQEWGGTKAFVVGFVLVFLDFPHGLIQLVSSLLNPNPLVKVVTNPPSSKIGYKRPV